MPQDTNPGKPTTRRYRPEAPMPLVRLAENVAWSAPMPASAREPEARDPVSSPPNRCDIVSIHLRDRQADAAPGPLQPLPKRAG